MNIFKRLSLFQYYRKTLKENKEELQTSYQLKIDMVKRLYTIWTLPEDQYNSYGELLLKQELDKYIRKIDRYLQSIGLSELYGIETKERISENSYKIVIRFSYLDTAFWANALLVLSIGMVMSMVLGLTFFGLFYLFGH